MHLTSPREQDGSKRALMIRRARSPCDADLVDVGLTATHLIDANLQSGTSAAIPTLGICGRLLR